MRSIASRMSVMSGEGALSVFARAKELEARAAPSFIWNSASPIFIPARRSSNPPPKLWPTAKTATAPSPEYPLCAKKSPRILHARATSHVSAANIVIAPGCKIALFLAMMALLEPGDEVLYPDPGFPGYPSITLGLGAVPVPFDALGAQSFSARPCRNCFEDYSPHAHADHEFSGQSHGNRLYRRSAARPRRTRRQARPLGALRRNLRAHSLRRRIFVHAALSRHGGAHADHRRILQELCHDRMAPGIYGRSAGSGSRAG